MKKYILPLFLFLFFVNVVEASPQITDPNSPVTWTRGTTQQIKWGDDSATSKNYPVSVIMSCNSKNYSLTESAPNTGFFSWVVGNSGTGEVIPDSTCSIRVKSNYDNFGDIMGSIDIVTPYSLLSPSITLNGYTTTAGTTKGTNLTWTTSNANRCVLKTNNTEEIVSVNGQKFVSPSQSTVYTLWCVNDPGDGKDGPAISRTITVPASTQVATQQYQTIRVSDNDDDFTTESSCLSLEYRMSYGSKDIYTKGEVTMVQDFLNDQGYLRVQPTGFFGLATTRAVKDFQKDNGISQTGSTGPLTRAKIKEISCSLSSKDVPAVFNRAEMDTSNQRRQLEELQAILKALLEKFR